MCHVTREGEGRETGGSTWQEEEMGIKSVRGRKKDGEGEGRYGIGGKEGAVLG